MTPPIWSLGKQALRCTRGSGTRPWATCSTGRCCARPLPPTSSKDWVLSLVSRLSSSVIFLFAKIQNLQMLPQIPALVPRFEQALPGRPEGGGPDSLPGCGEAGRAYGDTTFCWSEAGLPMALLGSGSGHLGAAVAARAQFPWLRLPSAQGRGPRGRGSRGLVPLLPPLQPACPHSSAPRTLSWLVFRASHPGPHEACHPSVTTLCDLPQGQGWWASGKERQPLAL